MKRSAGLLLWRRVTTGRGVEVLLAHPGGPLFARKDDGNWTIPKGEIDPGEDELAAARREFAEELGIAAPDGEPTPLGEVRQSSGKVNVIWALEADPGPFEVSSNLFDLEWPPRSGRIGQYPEVDQARWFAIDDAPAKLFVSQRFFIERLAGIVA